MRILIPTLTLVLLVVAGTGCSIKQIAMDAVADALSSETGGSFSQDEDLEFVGEALPFALKMMESINGSVPEHVPMKRQLASGFTQYGAVFVQWPADQLKYTDFDGYEEGRARARGFYRRATGYALDGLDLVHDDFRSRIFEDTDAMLAETTVDDIGLLYWLSASWMAAALTDLENPENFGLFPVAAAVVKRCYELDPDWNEGAIDELLISLEPALPMPGGEERAKEHYARAVELAGGQTAGPHVSLATSVALPAQDKDEFVRLLELALAVDLEASPESRLANDYAQAKARFYLDHLDDLFF